MTVIEMHFSSKNEVLSISQTQLTSWSFQHPSLGETLVATRGIWGYGDSTSFTWTKGLRAVCILLLEAKRLLNGSIPYQLAQVAGSRKSNVASLDDAIYKKTSWLEALFGIDKRGNFVASKVFIRSNPGHKRPGDNLVRLNVNFLNDLTIGVFNNSDEVSSDSDIMALISSISLDSTQSQNRNFIILGGRSDETNFDLNSDGTSLNNTGDSENNSVEKLIEIHPAQMNFRTEWSQLLLKVAQNTSHNLMGMVRDQEIGSWWQTDLGRRYTCINHLLANTGKKCKRIYLLEDGDLYHETRDRIFENILLHHFCGVEVRLSTAVSEMDNEIRSLGGNIFSLHDDVFCGVHQLQPDVDQTTIISKKQDIKYAKDLYNAIWCDDRLSRDINDDLKNHPRARVLQARAKSQFDTLLRYAIKHLTRVR